MANLKPVLIFLVVFAALWLIGELVITLVIAQTLGCPGTGAFTECALTWWHAVDALLFIIVCSQIAAMPNSEFRLLRGDEGLPPWLPAFVAVAALTADIMIVASRYSLVAPLTWALWQWWFILFFDLLLVFTAGGLLVIELALLFGVNASRVLR